MHTLSSNSSTTNDFGQSRGSISSWAYFRISIRYSRPTVSPNPMCCSHRLPPQLIDILAVADFSLGASQIKLLLELEKSDVRLILRDLKSVIELGGPGGDSWLELHHASFLDSLRDPKRSGPFHVRNPDRHTRGSSYDISSRHFRWDATIPVGYIFSSG
ncbi:hypothetical protein B0H17DRAFT_483377 [Mycena rosella]|uniref:Uncharacterized protein n=1 Tax=Mycena rosella TaxID=1033263 RepID=A0AAD7GL01_MYCRO|nr:hypothetical protein B0H17DRAFT_483377 [Mycena rosella]